MYRGQANGPVSAMKANMSKGVGFKGYSSSDPSLDLQNPSSIFRENLRARVRENERRLGTLVRSTTDNYRTSEAKDDFESEEYPRPHKRSGSSDFLYDKLIGIEEGFSQQARKIKSLENDLSDRDDEINLLRSELVKKLEKIVELEFELKASTPAFDEELLSLSGDQLYDIDLNESFRGSDSRSIELKKAKMMVSKLMTDLRNLETRYKEDQLKSARLIEELRLQNGDLRDSRTTKVVELEKKVQEVEEERTRLSRTVESKNMQIDNLKKELANLRLNQLSSRGGYDSQFSDFDRELLRTSPNVNRSNDTIQRTPSDEFDRERQLPSANYSRDERLLEPVSPGRSIRFYDEVDDEPLSRTKEAQMELIQQSLMKAGTFERVDAPRQMLSEADVFPRTETSRSNGSDANRRISSRPIDVNGRSSSIRAVKQDQEQAIQRAKKSGFFSLRRFGRA